MADDGANIQPSLEPCIQRGDRTASLSSGIASEIFAGVSKILQVPTSALSVHF